MNGLEASFGPSTAPGADSEAAVGSVGAQGGPGQTGLASEHQVAQMAVDVAELAPAVPVQAPAPTPGRTAPAGAPDPAHDHAPVTAQDHAPVTAQDHAP